MLVDRQRLIFQLKVKVHDRYWSGGSQHDMKVDRQTKGEVEAEALTRTEPRFGVGFIFGSGQR